MSKDPTPSRFANKALIHPSGTPHPQPHSRLPAPTQPAEGQLPTTPQAEDWSGRTEAFLAAQPEASAAADPAARGRSDLAEVFRHSSWRPFRQRVLAALKETPGVSPRRISAFCTCGCDATVEVIYSKWFPGRITDQRIRSTKCHDRFCVPCSSERSWRIRQSLLTHMFKRKDMSLITLTLLQSAAPLSELLDRIGKHFKALRNRPLWKKAVAGGACIVETKVSDDGKHWNVHMHVLAEAKYMPQQALSQEWHTVTGDSYVVDVRRVGAMTGAVQYITKYITKAADHSIVTNPKFLRESITAFTGRRLVSTFGSWRGLKLMERPEDENSAALASDWTTVGSLDAVIRSALAGDAASLELMRKLAPRKFATGRPQPPPAV